MYYMFQHISKGYSHVSGTVAIYEVDPNPNIYLTDPKFKPNPNS